MNSGDSGSKLSSVSEACKVCSKALLPIGGWLAPRHYTNGLKRAMARGRTLDRVNALGNLRGQAELDVRKRTQKRESRVAASGRARARRAPRKPWIAARPNGRGSEHIPFATHGFEADKTEADRIEANRLRRTGGGARPQPGQSGGWKARQRGRHRGRDGQLGTQPGCRALVRQKIKTASSPW